MKEPFANLTVMDHLNDCIRKDKGSFDKNECLQAICEALTVIMKNEGKYFPKLWKDQMEETILMIA